MGIEKEKLIKLVDTLPAFPASVHKVLELTAKPDCLPRDLVAVIEHDPVLTIKILKLVNSAYFGLSREVTSISHAVVYVGLNTVKNVAISVAASGVLPKENKAGLDMQEFWLHSLTVGVIGRTLARGKGAGPSQLANLFVAGLLHDIGRVLMAHFYADDYRPVIAAQEHSTSPLHEIEKQVIGMSHDYLGAKIAERWQLPGDLIEAIKAHHHIEAYDKPAELAIGLSCANKIEGFMSAKAKDPDYPAPELCELEKNWLAASVEDAVASMSDLEDEIAKAKAFINM